MPGLEQLASLGAAHPLEPACDRFHFLRHGQTARNALRIFQTVDEPLSELGLTQAARAAERLASEPIRAVVCSDARRAFDTAQVVASRLHLTPTRLPALRERNFGALIGTSSANVDWACDPEGGETLAQFVDRTRGAFEAALALPGPVLVVAHGGTLYALVAMLGIGADTLPIGNAQPLRFRRGHGDGWRVEALLPATAADLNPAAGAAIA
jgi:broad specificity phosphatase PhoE